MTSTLPDTSTHAVALTGISRTYPGPPPLTALHDCNLTIGDGEFVSIVGPSGSGKSTMLNIIGLIDRPTEGEYLLAGVDVTTASDTQRARIRGAEIGFVFQAYELMANRSALDNVMLAGLYVGHSLTERRARALEALDAVGLADKQDAVPARMSGGEKQRVAIARAIASKPTILLCDEPTGNLDSRTAHTVLSTLERLNDAGVTLVIITHDAEVAGRASRTIAITDGLVREAS